MYRQLELFGVVQYATSACSDDWYGDYDEYAVCIDIGYVYDDTDYRDYCFISAQYGVTPLFL